MSREPSMTDIPGIGRRRAAKLVECGFDSVGDVAQGAVEAIAEVAGLGPARAAEVKRAAATLLAHEGSAQDPPPGPAQPLEMTPPGEAPVGEISAGGVPETSIANEAEEPEKPQKRGKAKKEETGDKPKKTKKKEKAKRKKKDKKGRKQKRSKGKKSKKKRKKEK